MSIHDYVIANQTGANTRADLNLLFQAIVSHNSNANEPVNKYAYMFWADTTANILKVRNSGNTAWINVFSLTTGANVGSLPLSGGTMSGAIAMGSSKITGLGTPSATTDAVTKAYSDLKLPLTGGTVTGALIVKGNGSAKSIDVEANGTMKLFTAGTERIALNNSGVEITGAVTIAGVCTATSFTGNGSNLTGITSLPSQSGNAGKFLTTNATVASWATVDALPSQSGNSGKFLTSNGTAASWAVLNTDSNTTSKGLYEMKNTITANYAITSGNNAITAGPITINSGVSVSIPSNSTWVIA